jgi:ABC-type Fe3+/spermidine/putrescine transport system ATPase subunit
MLKVEKLVKHYGSRAVLENICLDVRPGEVLTVLGPSGSGKTTLLRIIAGFEMPDRGKILLNDVELSSAAHRVPPHQRKLSMIFQDLALWPHMTAAASLKFVLHNQNLSDSGIEAKITEMLAMVNLTGYERRYPHELSGGEKQRLAIARAFVTNPSYLLMDEPFSDLDHLIISELIRVLLDHRDRFQTGVLYVTHNIEEALELSDRLAIFNQGRMEQIGKTGDVLGNPCNEFVKRFLKVVS